MWVQMCVGVWVCRCVGVFSLHEQICIQVIDGVTEDVATLSVC